ncbi:MULTISPECIES: hypothetical protein [Cyanophyceae]|jgi:hypothetical protein|uniref:Uncharacterized protein n=1 Tax=Nodularia spumigena UHCC 0060 TaxID=3110300 RepID=A0ABU5URI6_NODSP|nr:MULTISPECIES: hypothetical protein [Cyanophyceae]MDB9358575.1 hypothetical protein [Nodularia spumigena CS-587/03]AHJ26571.1 hypothetical protein NSP_2150 [Nodularia spumigena CCY9414]EAW46168.1 hypothetical protein N9414_19717 [Nodularia spumigena CCY9414]MDB9341755.1 hypothetical protein [Nodularia spumigena CS-589/07]MDB9399835.1 hypothetical protein [Microcystis aeruginosa CS-567/02-A1]
MTIIRQYIAPLLAVLVFSLALVAVSARIFLPSDMAAPAPIEDNGEIGQWGNGDSELFAFFAQPPLLS